MINILLVMYFCALILLVLISLAVVYHLRAYQLNHKISTLATLVFVVGMILIFAFNVVSALQVDWKSLPSVITY